MLEVHLDLGGYPVTLIDTAGIRESVGVVEKEGIRRALVQAEKADLILWTYAPNVEQEDLPESLKTSGAEIWQLNTKSDLGAVADHDSFETTEEINVSVRDEGGMNTLLSSLESFAERNIGLIENPLITRERHRSHLTQCVDDLYRAIKAVGYPIELRGEDLRRAADQLGRITGSIDVEDLLDVIFRDFCVGK